MRRAAALIVAAGLAAWPAHALGASAPPLLSQDSTAPSIDSTYGSGHFGSWGVDGFGLPFYRYDVDEAKKTVTFHIVAASFPNWQGESQTRTIDKLTADEFVNTNPNVAGGRGKASNYYKRAK